MRTELKERKTEFKAWLKHERQLAETTAARYACCIPRYLDHCGALVPSPEDAQEFRLHLLQQDFAASTLRNNLFAIEHYQAMVGEPVDLRKPKQERSLPQFLKREEAQELLFACEDTRNYAILHVLLYGGLRASEVTGARRRDWDARERTLLVRDGKGGKDRVVILSKKAADAVNQWLREADIQSGSLFPSQRGGALGRRQVLRIVKTCAARAGLNEDVTPHTLRHTFATHALREGMSVTDLQAQLGHADPKTTLIYTQVVTDGRKEAYDESTPRF